MVDNRSIAALAFPMGMLESLSKDEILLPRFVKWFTNFKVIIEGGDLKSDKRR